MKPVDVKDNTSTTLVKKVMIKTRNLFKLGDCVRISKYQNILAKGYTPNWSEEVFVTKKVKNTVPWTYIINDINSEEIYGTFCRVGQIYLYPPVFRARSFTYFKLFHNFILFSMSKIRCVSRNNFHTSDASVKSYVFRRICLKHGI